MRRCISIPPNVLLVAALCAAIGGAVLAQQATLGPPEILGEVTPASPLVDGQTPYLELDYGDGRAVPGFLPLSDAPPWTWQIVPSGLLYRSYLAGPRESRLASVWNWQTPGGGRFWDFTLGGHVGLLRYGTAGGPRPGGFQLDADAAAFPRLDLRNENDLTSVDFRGGIPLTFAYGPWESKFGYYHTSSHLGDEFLLKHQGFPRLNYVRDELILGVACRIRPSLRLYGEAGYAFHCDGGARPWQFQFGAECSDLEPRGLRGAPFLAVNGHLRQEVSWGGSLSAQAGWQWRGAGPGHLLRAGVNYFNGMSEQYSFLHQFEQQVGTGIWYDY
jgi:hypothetical protein